MNAQFLAQTAYASASIPTRTERGAEYEVFARITHRLKSAARMEDGFNALVAALHDNRTLWTALAADVATQTNGLPQDLRARIFYLAEFTTHQTRRILAGEADAEALVDVNMAVMRGLRQGGDAT